MAEEWVDNHCGSKYWTIIRLADTLCSVVICINCDNSNPTDFDSLDWDKIVYGWLDTKEEAEDWVSKIVPIAINIK